MKLWFRHYCTTKLFSFPLFSTLLLVSVPSRHGLPCLCTTLTCGMDSLCLCALTAWTPLSLYHSYLWHGLTMCLCAPMAWTLISCLYAPWHGLPASKRSRVSEEAENFLIFWPYTRPQRIFRFVANFPYVCGLVINCSLLFSGDEVASQDHHPDRSAKRGMMMMTGQVPGVSVAGASVEVSCVAV